jgi:ribosomal-protein-alanine N-acetyltransferase
MLEKKDEFFIRPCNYDELPEVITINESTLPENYPLYFYEQILERYPDCFLVTELTNSPGKLIGYVMWRIERGISSFGIQLVRKGHLVSIAVSEKYRRIGAATQMLLKSMRKVIDYNVSEFVLEVRISNHSAIQLYQNVFNFKKIRILEKYYRDGENAFYFALKTENYPFI